MEFSSLPLYLDPSNWNQHLADNPSAGGDGELQSLALVPHLEAEISTSAARPNSMSERARLAKIPQPEPSMKCPRCDSTNTKFCYFNNYSLSQPRHFCKTCRRYWTRGGSLRNVPVGGGCRRNKRSKSGGVSSAKSSGSTVITSSATNGAVFPSNIFGHTPQLPFMSSLQELMNYGSANLGWSFSGFPQNDASDYLVPSSSSSGLDQWKFQQFPFSGGFDPHPSTSPAAGLFSFKVDQFGSMALPKVSCSGIISQLASVKMEDNPGFAMPRQNFAIPGNDQYWCGDGGEERGSDVLGWAADLSTFNSLSSDNLL